MPQKFGSVEIVGDSNNPKVVSEPKDKLIKSKHINQDEQFEFWGVISNNGNGFVHGTWNGGDVEITDANKGVILRSANGKRWRITVKNNGSLKCKEVI